MEVSGIEKLKDLYVTGDISPRISNEVLEDILNTNDLKNASHRIVAYVVLGVVSYLHINGKYDQYIISTKDIKKFIGYNPDNKKIDYILKKNGFLHNRGYIFEKRETLSKKKNNKIRIPNVLDEMKECHTFNLSLFFKCMDSPQLGIKAFVIINYIKEIEREFKYGRHGDIKKLTYKIPLNHHTMTYNLKALYDEGMINKEEVQEREIDFPLNLHLRGKLWWWRDIAKQVHEEKCFISGKTSNLIIHHVISFSQIRDFVFNFHSVEYKKLEDYNEQELDLVNSMIADYHRLATGVPLEKEIHRQFHMKYGSNATMENLLEFKMNYSR